MHWQGQGLRAKSEWLFEGIRFSHKTHKKKTEARKIVKLFPLFPLFYCIGGCFLSWVTNALHRAKLLSVIPGCLSDLPDIIPQAPLSKWHLRPYLLLQLRMCTCISPCVDFVFFLSDLTLLSFSSSKYVCSYLCRWVRCMDKFPKPD